jgi:hypothetical protein
LINEDRGTAPSALTGLRPKPCQFWAMGFSALVEAAFHWREL